MIVFKIFRGLAPSYLSFLITSKPVSKYNLRSSSDGTLLSFPNIKPEATLGERAFVFAALKLQNALPRFIRETNSINSFKRQLKTYLFEKAFRTTQIIRSYFQLRLFLYFNHKIFITSMAHLNIFIQIFAPIKLSSFTTTLTIFF